MLFTHPLQMLNMEERYTKYNLSADYEVEKARKPVLSIKNSHFSSALKNSFLILFSMAVIKVFYSVLKFCGNKKYTNNGFLLNHMDECQTL